MNGQDLKNNIIDLVNFLYKHYKYWIEETSSLRNTPPNTLDLIEKGLKKDGEIAESFKAKFFSVLITAYFDQIFEKATQLILEYEEIDQLKFSTKLFHL